MTDHIELRHLRAFVAVAEELNFSRAARKLHLVQQSLSAQVHQLEDVLGVQLFRRTTRRVELSDAGVALLEHARTIIGLVATATDETRRAASGESAHLTISYTPTLANDTLPRLVSALHARYPSLTLQICEMWQTESVEAIRSGRLDVGMARCPDISPDLEAVRLRNEPIGVVLGQSHPLVSEPHLTVEQLAEATLAIWPRQFSPGFFDQVVNSYRGNGFHGDIQEFEYLTAAVFLGDPAARAAISAGKAFSVAFETQFDPVPTGFVWKAVEPAPLIPVQLYWRRASRAAVPLFVEVALAVATAEGWLRIQAAAQGGRS